MTRLLIVDDHDFVRSQLVAIFQPVDDIEVVGECSAGDQVIPAATSVQPDVVLMDLQLGGTSGIEVTRSLLAVRPSVRVLVLTGWRTNTAQQQSLDAGASGFLLKGGAADCLVSAVRTVARGGTWWLPGRGMLNCEQ